MKKIGSEKLLSQSAKITLFYPKSADSLLNYNIQQFYKYLSLSLVFGPIWLF